MSNKRDAGLSDDEHTPHVVLRIRLAREIAADRIRTSATGKKLKPLAWKTIAAKHDLSIRQCERIFKDLEGWEAEIADPLAIIQRSIDLRTAAQDKLSQIADDGDSSSARVGAIRQLIETDRDRLELLQAVGRLPKNMARYRAETDFVTIVREMLNVLEREKVPREILAELREIAERHLNTPIGDSNVTPIRKAA